MHYHVAELVVFLLLRLGTTIFLTRLAETSCSANEGPAAVKMLRPSSVVSGSVRPRMLIAPASPPPVGHLDAGDAGEVLVPPRDYAKGVQVPDQITYSVEIDGRSAHERFFA